MRTPTLSLKRLVVACALIVAVLAGAAPAGAATSFARTKGAPTSTNGASSMHVGWTDRGTTMREVSAVLEIRQAPTAGRLYFWALQVDFVDRGQKVGGAHLGLQWDAKRPGMTAVNFGGYRTVGGVTRELTGTSSSLPSATGDANTRDFAWIVGHHYRLRIYSAGDGWWAGEITDIETGAVTVVRKLQAGGTLLTRPLVWSEIFAPCDAPSSAVRWSALAPAPTTVRVTYQSYETGGCTNTTTERSGTDGFVQRTNTRRTVADFTTLTVGR
jgi:hypothetical protein